MKKMLLILALSVVGFANAQKGTILVGGDIDYTTRTVDAETGKIKMNSFDFSPKVGYQFHDNWTAGAEFTISSLKQDGQMSEVKNNAYKVGAFVRYTMPLSETFSVFADLGAGFTASKGKAYNNDDLISESKANGFYTDLTPALFINMKKGFGLNFSIGGLGYTTYSYDNVDIDERSFYFNFGKTISVGISKNF
ncbi:outer membrane beta-barrel protein [Flavobacterium pectinovorum]|uniref:outer membrane beta-barrel protein n=1 Tax=Flavobacterium pectinovorum TaxID=29533 RepID=UPI001FABC6CB|nr:outer membrane beta-barrel protein [Flavobacterium pectinovorum]MCI9846627.1 porin family protein [Flavobacterium pectinovorum]